MQSRIEENVGVAEHELTVKMANHRLIGILPAKRGAPAPYVAVYIDNTGVPATLYINSDGTAVCDTNKDKTVIPLPYTMSRWFVLVKNGAGSYSLKGPLLRNSVDGEVQEAKNNGGQVLSITEVWFTEGEFTK